MISKELFVAAIKALELQEKHDTEFEEKVMDLFRLNTQECLRYDISYLSNIIIKILQDSLQPVNKSAFCAIEFFCFELSFGALYKKDSFKAGDCFVDISTPELLYDFLIKHNK